MLFYTVSVLGYQWLYICFVMLFCGLGIEVWTRINQTATMCSQTNHAPSPAFLTYSARFTFMAESYILFWTFNAFSHINLVWIDEFVYYSANYSLG